MNDTFKNHYYVKLMFYNIECLFCGGQDQKVCLVFFCTGWQGRRLRKFHLRLDQLRWIYFEHVRRGRSENTVYHLRKLYIFFHFKTLAVGNFLCSKLSSKLVIAEYRVFNCLLSDIEIEWPCNLSFKCTLVSILGWDKRKKKESQDCPDSTGTVSSCLESRMLLK